MKHLNLSSSQTNSLKNILSFLILSAVFSFLSPQPVFAAPYGEKNVTTVYDRLYESDLVIYGKIVQKLVQNKTQKIGRTEIQIFEGVKGDDWKKGDFFYINSILKEKDKSVGLFYIFKQYKGGGAFFQLNAFYPDKDKTMYEYTKRINEFLSKNDNTGRIRFLFSQVNSRNKLIAWDSFAQLGKASYYDLKKSADDINNQSLRWLIAAPDVKDNRKSFYAFLFGLKSDPEDMELVKRIIANKKNHDSEIIYGAMMAYGLLFNDHPDFFYKLARGQNSQTVKLAVLEAVLNLMKYERPAKPDNLLKSYYYLLSGGDKKVTLTALRIAQELKMSGPIRYMDEIYTGRFRNDAQVKIAVITYLKLLRKAPGAMKLLYKFKEMEQDPKVKKTFTM